MRRCRRAGRRACGITSALCFRSAAEDKKIWLAMYRKRLGAPRPGEGPPPVLFLVHGSSSGAKIELRSDGRARRILDDERVRPRRLEILEDMQKRYGFAPLGAADGPVKTAIFSGNSARIYKFEQHAARRTADRFAELEQQYESAGPARCNLRYGIRAAVHVTQEALYGNTMILDLLLAE